MSELQRYRAEIDGLRAIAVVAVVLFHARVSGFTGGYVGVDIFFVISGYLITGQILADSATGRFSVLSFYERRIRRLMPALFVVLLVSSAAALLLLPADLKRYSASLVAVIAFVSNLLFWRWSGYFQPDSASMPLLHTWSLAVEEQFYVLFPLCLFLLQKVTRRSLAAVICVVALVSFAHCLWSTYHVPDLAFYSPLSRAWELLLGSLLATGVLPPPTRRRFNDVLAGAGLASIGYAIFHFTEASPFPGSNALAPCLGAAMIIRGTQVPGTFVARALKLKPLVSIGLVSYSLYLWHWPLIVFSTYYVLDPRFESWVRIAMAIVSIPIAFVSWRFIECPFRGRSGRYSRRALFTYTFAISATFVVLGSIGYALQGLPSRFDKTALQLRIASSPPSYVCANRPLEQLQTDKACIIGDHSARPSFILWGDSHANVLHSALDAAAITHTVAGYNMTAFGCPPVTGEQRSKLNDKCRIRNQLIMQAIESNRPRAVILAAHWAFYFEEALQADGLNEEERDAIRRRYRGVYTRETFRSQLQNTVDTLRRLGIAVYFVEDVPTVPSAKPDLLTKSHLLGITKQIEPLTADYERQNAPIRAVTHDLERQGLLHVLAPQGLLCGSQYCRVTEGSNPLYFDADHLNQRGAQLLQPLFESMMRDLQAPARQPQ